MTETTEGYALVLAAHGWASGFTLHEVVEGYVDCLGELPHFDEVTAAYHLGEPSFAIVLDQLRARRIVVVPLMTSRGYFTDVVLPKELAQNRRWPDVDLTITDPVGTHRDMASIVSRRIGDGIDRQGFDANETSVILVGHGTSRHPHSSESTLQLVDTLKREHSTWDVSAAFLDEVPTLETALNNARHENVLVEPFFIADGPHASQDIPRRLGMETRGGQSLPFVQRIANRTVLCDSAVGTDPAILDFITDLAVQCIEHPQQ